MCSLYIDRNGSLNENKIPIKFIDNTLRLIWNYDPGIAPFVINRDILCKEKFKKDFFLGEDLHLIMRIASKFNVKIIKRPLYCIKEHENQSSGWKFDSNIKQNAYNSLECLKEIIENNSMIYKFIPKNEIFHKLNHTVYGFASAAMKKNEFSLFFSLFSELSFKGNKSILLYYFISLIIRLPFYFIKNAGN